MSIRELRSSTSRLKEILSVDGKIVLTTNGKPAALLLDLDEDTMEEVLIDFRIAQSRRAIRKMQDQSVHSGNNNMTLDEINNEIASARREKAEA